MINPAYLVEGDLEQKFIQNSCPGAPVQKINCNGDNTSLCAVSKRVGSLGRILQRRCSLLIIIFDREGRTATSQEIEQEFFRLLKEENLQVPVVIGIPDREIESWILADHEQFCQCAQLEQVYSESVEGNSGKALIKKILGPNRPYVETIDGVKWLKASRPSEIKKRSTSFARFHAQLACLNGCWWLGRQLDLALGKEAKEELTAEHD